MQTEENPGINPVILSSDDEENELQQPPTKNNNYQIVLYNPDPEPEPDPDPRTQYPRTQRVLPAVGSFTVQCAECFKWRLIPTKEKYEEIRERILQAPFRCEVAQEWRGVGEVSCETEGDIEQDNSRLWAIDKPNIAQPPPGWERELRIRGEGCSKFADVYYIAPSGKRLRSSVEVQKYLYDHPEYIMQGVTISQFSFQIPKPLQENYVRKRPRLPPSDASNFGMPSPLQTITANPLSWAAPGDATALQLVQPGFFDDVNPPVQKKARSSTKRSHCSNPLQHSPRKFKINGPRLPQNGVYENNDL